MVWLEGRMEGKPEKEDSRRVEKKEFRVHLVVLTVEDRQGEEMKRGG